MNPGGCCITFSDQGPGIPEDCREKYFEALSQGPRNPGDTDTGLGLGLSIARLTARAYGGDVEILDTNSGCTVRFEIAPVKSADTAPWG